MDILCISGLFSTNWIELKKGSPISLRFSQLRSVYHRSRRNVKLSAFRGSLSGSGELEEDELLQIFLKERQINGDFISRVTDNLWKKDLLNLINSGTYTEGGNDTQQFEESLQFENREDEDGFLKLTRTKKWILGESIAPMNGKSVSKDWQDESEKRKRLNLLKYDAIKRELFLLTICIGVACSGYCILMLSVEAAISYAVGVLFSCLYLQLLYNHTDNLTWERVPQIFRQKKIKKIGIRSDDLKNSIERIWKGSTFALSSPRLVIPAAIYGIWIFSHRFLDNSFDFQIVPAMFGLFAYKASALVQVYRDNEDLKLIFPDTEEE